MTDVIPPHDLEAELCVLGSLLLADDKSLAQEVRDILAPADFYRGPHADVFRAQCDLWESTGACDVVLLRDHLAAIGALEKVGGTSFLSRIAAATPTTSNAVLYAKIVREKRLERDVAGLAARYERLTNENGNGLADEAFHELSLARTALDDFRHPATRKPRFVSVGAHDLLNTTLPMIEELVRPRVIYRGGVTVLVASHKRGKSLAALGLCVDLVLNIALPLDTPDEASPRWLGQEVFGRGPVLVYSAEGGERMIQERLRKLAPRCGTELNDLHVYAKKPTPRLDNPQDLADVFAHAEEVGAVLLVFDPLGRFWAMEDEADPTAARNLMEAIQIHAEQAYAGRGIAVLIIHHDTKAIGSDADSAISGGRGSGKFGDDADALINLKLVSDGEPGESQAKFLLRHAESPAPVRVRINKDSLRLSELPSDHSPSHSGNKRGRKPILSLGALEQVVRSKGRIEAIRVADELGVSFSTWEKNRKEMVGELVELGVVEVSYAPGSNRQILVWSGRTAEMHSEPEYPTH